MHRVLLIFFILGLASGAQSQNTAPRCQGLFTNPAHEALSYAFKNRAYTDINTREIDFAAQLVQEKKINPEALVNRFVEFEFILQTEYRVPRTPIESLKLAALSIEQNISKQEVIGRLLLMKASFQKRTQMQVPFRVQVQLIEKFWTEERTINSIVNEYLEDFTRAQNL